MSEWVCSRSVAALAVGTVRPRIALSGTLEMGLAKPVLPLVTQVQRRPRRVQGARAHARAAAEAGQDGCVIYCTLLQAEAGESWGWAGFRSWLPQAAPWSLQPWLSCLGGSGTEQKSSPGRFSVLPRGVHGCFEPAAGAGPGISW